MNFLMSTTPLENWVSRVADAAVDFLSVAADLGLVPSYEEAVAGAATNYELPRAAVVDVWHYVAVYEGRRLAKAGIIDYRAIRNLRLLARRMSVRTPVFWKVEL